VKKWISLLLVAVLSVSMFASCKEKYTEVMTINGEELPAGIYLICQLSAYSEAVSLAEDPDKDVLEQQIEGVDATDWIYEHTLEKAQQYMYVEQTFAELELEFTTDELAQYEAEMETSWVAYGYIYEQNGIGYESFEAFAYNTYKQTKIYSEYMADEEWALSDEEAMAYLAEHYVKVEMVYLYKISALDYTKLPEDSIAMVHSGADSLALSLNNGSVDKVTSIERFIKPSYLLIGYDEESIIDTPETYYRVSYVSVDDTTYSTEFVEEMFAAEVNGVYYVTEQENFFAVWTKIANYETAEEFEVLKPSIRYEMMDEAFYEEFEANSAALEMVIDEAAVAHYSPKNIVW